MKCLPFNKIDLETHSYCNRRCSWCSNSVYDRTFMKILPDKLFSKLIDELRDYNYSNPIFLHRYNEPLANRDNIEKRIKEIRDKLPKVKIGMNTNGSYNYKNLDVDYLTVIDYNNNLESYCDEENGIRITRLDELDLCDRAGVLKLGKERTIPCTEPINVATVDYLGYITFCCNMRYEVPDHMPYIFGNIEDISLYDAYHSKEAEQFRNDVLNMRFPKPCKLCNMLPGRFSKPNGKLCGEMNE